MGRPGDVGNLELLAEDVGRGVEHDSVPPADIEDVVGGANGAPGFGLLGAFCWVIGHEAFELFEESFDLTDVQQRRNHDEAVLVEVGDLVGSKAPIAESGLVISVRRISINSGRGPATCRSRPRVGWSRACPLRGGEAVGTPGSVAWGLGRAFHHSPWVYELAVLELFARQVELDPARQEIPPVVAVRLRVEAYVPDHQIAAEKVVDNERGDVAVTPRWVGGGPSRPGSVIGRAGVGRPAESQGTVNLGEGEHHAAQFCRADGKPSGPGPRSGRRDERIRQLAQLAVDALVP
jgi:hypothetical protein